MCFLEGPEAGIGNPLGKNPRKCPTFFDLGLTLKKVVLLEQSYLPTIKVKRKKNRKRWITGLLCKPIKQRKDGMNSVEKLIW